MKGEKPKLYVALDERLSLYAFADHPFSRQRYFAFEGALKKKDLISLLGKVEAREASLDELLLFHTKDYINFVQEKENEGGYLDLGDTPAFSEMFKASRIVVGTTLNCIDKAIENNVKVFNPIGGLHHAFSDHAGGFCIFNDVGVGINYLRQKHKIRKILYFDIDAHHADGVYYSFNEDPDIFIVDTHQKGIFPGTGSEREKGKDKAYGTKLNIELEPGCQDEDYFKLLEKAKEFLDKIKVEFIILQAGADSLAGDPITFLDLTENVHREVAGILAKKADSQTNQRMLILGGGGYSLSNIEKGWVAVAQELCQ